MQYVNDIPEYKIWNAMNQRCNNPKRPNYHLYGGRGIKVCSEWHDFYRFYKDMGPRPSKQHSIERIDNDGDYCPSNCKWATQDEQALNRRSNRYIEYQGKRLCVTQWAQTLGLPRKHIYDRLYRGLPIEIVLSPDPAPRLPRQRGSVFLKSHCPHGHPYSGDNLITRRGFRECRICKLKHSRESKARRRLLKKSNLDGED